MLAPVQIAASFKYCFGLTVVVAMSSGSGGIGKKELSMNAKAASARVEFLVSAQLTTQAYSLRILRRGKPKMFKAKSKGLDWTNA
jgi:hypothetical protein